MTASQRLPAGTLLGGRYRLFEPMPGGGRSWAARDEVDGRELIARLIVLPDTMPAVERDAARQRAMHDAATLSRVRHAAVAHVVDTVVDDGVPWVVSVLPPGRSPRRAAARGWADAGGAGSADGAARARCTGGGAGAAR